MAPLETRQSICDRAVAAWAQEVSPPPTVTKAAVFDGALVLTDRCLLDVACGINSMKPKSLRGRLPLANVQAFVRLGTSVPIRVGSLPLGGMLGGSGTMWVFEILVGTQFDRFVQEFHNLRPQG